MVALAWGRRSLIPLLAAVCAQAAPPLPDLPPVLEVGYSSRMLSDVDATDARAVTRVWIETFVRNIGQDVDCETFIFSAPADIADAFDAGQLDLVVLPAEEFIQLRRLTPVVPIFVSMQNGQTFLHYGLLTRTDTVSLADLRSSHVVLESHELSRVPRLWLEEQLRKAGLPAANAHFQELTRVDKIAQAVLPVFFGTADACVVNLESFHTMAELNPQLGRQLHALATSQPFANPILCARPDFYETYSHLVSPSLLSLHSDPEGQQVLNLFHVDRLIPFQPTHLTEIEALMGRSPAGLNDSSRYLGNTRAP